MSPLPIFLLALVASLLPFVRAQQDHQILVGADGLSYSPFNITAAANDTVTFVWVPPKSAAKGTNHSVTQSTFAAPCQSLLNATTNQRGFDSGYPVKSDASSAPTWTLQITSTTPIWFYCAQGRHCAQGMVGSINAPTSGSKTFEAFQQAAMGASQIDPAGSAVPVGNGASATGGPSSVSGIPAASPSAAGNSAVASASSSSSAATPTFSVPWAACVVSLAALGWALLA